MNAQAGLCPTNMDFELGDFTNWQCRTGKVSSSNSENIINWTATGQLNDRHTIITSSQAKNDQYGNFPEVPPNANGFSVRLGNADVFSLAESISYDYVIPANTQTFSISYQYAVVLQNPGHAFYDQPRFKANVINLTDNTVIDCVSFDFTASSSLPGFKVSSFDPSVLYKDWTPVILDLAVYAGKTIRLEFITSDCVLEAHFGYAYIDVSPSCSGTFNGNIICQGDKTVTLRPPPGYKTYQWFADNSFSQQISTNPILLLDPVPAAGSIFPVIITPFSGFGCTDTLYAAIAISAKPISRAGTDVDVCRYQPIQIGTANNPAYSYDWKPASFVNNPIASNPMAWNPTRVPKELIVKTTDRLSQCFSYDTIVLTTRYVDTALVFNGKNNFCMGEPTPAILSASTAVSAVQWLTNNKPLNGATGISYQPVVSGIYSARVMQNGCADTTASIAINIYEACNYMPSAFTPNGDGLNDTVRPFMFGVKTFKNFSIYNRWGNRVFYAEKNGEGWDGTYGGKKLDAGIYIWILKVVTSDGKAETQKGTITLIR